MPSGVIVPVLATTGVAFVNTWYNTRTVDLKIPVAGAIAAAIGAGFSQIPGFAGVMTSVGWIAFVGYMLAGGGGKGTPVDTLTKITGGL